MDLFVAELHAVFVLQQVAALPPAVNQKRGTRVRFRLKSAAIFVAPTIQ
jgi:hypothetical protein